MCGRAPRGCVRIITPSAEQVKGVCMLEEAASKDLSVTSKSNALLQPVPGSGPGALPGEDWRKPCGRKDGGAPEAEVVQMIKRWQALPALVAGCDRAGRAAAWALGRSPRFPFQSPRPFRHSQRGSTFQLLEQCLCFRVVGAQSDRFPQCCHSVFPPVLDGEGGSQAVVGLGVFRFVAQSLVKIGNCFLDSLRIQKCKSHTEMRGCVVGLEPEYFAKLLQALTVLATLQQGNTQVETGNRIHWA